MLELRFDYRQFLKTVSTQPGIYQMFDSNNNILYVGKAKNLKNRLSSYFRGLSNPKEPRQKAMSIKTQALVVKITSIQVTITESETAALVLEQNLIKALKPPYNISLRDDKSYPYIFISDGAYPRVASHRGSRKKGGEYFGPYPSTGSVYQSLNFLQKTFRIRQCEDSVFNNRSRPCLQYQINRCTAPCVNLISADEYQKDIQHATLFLKGQSNQLMRQLADEMEKASAQLAFEKAAFLRDQISALRQIQANHDRESSSSNIDIFALYRQANQICIHVIFIRDGRILGSKSYFNEDKLDMASQFFLLSFMEQFYLAGAKRELPSEIIINQPLLAETKQALLGVLEEKAQRKINITHKVKSQRHKWLLLANHAAEQNLLQQLGTKASLMKRFESLRDVLLLDELPERLECFDISHSSGELTVASCVVFNRQGALKSDYRRFNIEGITGGDDYAAMEQALMRRYTRIQKGEGKLPDILIVDGGKGQLSRAQKVISELGIQQVMLLGMAKGTTRKPGFEVLMLSDGSEKVLQSDSPALHLLQEVRDEAHRFAITGHKQRRDNKRKVSSLEGIPGIGPKRRRELLRHFGGVGSVKQAAISDLEKVPGISKKMAEDIYSALRNE